MATFAQMMEGPAKRIYSQEIDGSRFLIEFRQVGWLISGGPHNGEFVAWGEELVEKYISFPAGLISPVYIEIRK